MEDEERCNGQIQETGRCVGLLIYEIIGFRLSRNWISQARCDYYYNGYLGPLPRRQSSMEVIQT